MMASKKGSGKNRSHKSGLSAAQQKAAKDKLAETIRNTPPENITASQRKKAISLGILKPAGA